MSPDVPCCTFLLIRCHNLSSGYTNFHRVMQFSTRIQISRVTIWNTGLHSYRASGAGVVGHMLKQSSEMSMDDVCTKHYVDIQGISWKRYPQLSVCTRNRSIVSIERVYTQSTKYMKSAVHVPMHLKSVRG